MENPADKFIFPVGQIAVEDDDHESPSVFDIAALKARRERMLTSLEQALGAKQHVTGRPFAPKELRLFMEVLTTDVEALVQLLIEKGVISEVEYVVTATDKLDQALTSHEEFLSQQHHNKITFPR